MPELLPPPRPVRQLAQLRRQLEKAEGHFRESQSLLQEAESRFQRLVEQSPLGMHIWRLESDGRLVFADSNPAADRTLGIAAGELSEKTLEEAFAAVIGTPLPAAFRRVAAEGGSWKVSEFAYHDSRVSGIFEINAFQLSPGTIAVAFTDITVRRRSEDALRQSESRLRVIAEQLPCVSWTTDLSLRFTSSFGAGLKTIGLKPGEVEGMLLKDFFLGQTEGEAQLENHRRACSGETVSYETSAFDRRYQVYLEPLRNPSGAIAGVLGIAFDITDRKRAEDALKQSESQLRLITTQVPGAIWTTDCNLRFTSFYAAERKDLSLKPTHVVGMRLADFFANDQERDLSVAAHTQACAGKPIMYEAVVHGRQYFNYLEPLRDPAGNIIGVLGIALDIGDRKQTEAILRATEENYRRLIEQAPDGIVVTDSEGKIRLANSKMREMLRYAEDEILGLNFAETYTPEDRPLFLLRLERLRAGESLRHERLMVRKDGSSFPAEITVSMRVDGATQAIVRDISERRAAEEALHASEEKYHRFFEENLAGYYLMNPAGKFLECNPAFARMLGFASREDALSGNMASVCASPRDLEEFIALVGVRSRLEQFARVLRRKDGRLAHVLESAIGVFDPAGQLIGIRGFLIDDTERWQAEEQFRQVQKMDAIGRLAGGVAHDFNNLLTVINGYSELALRKSKSLPLLQRDLFEIRNAGQTAAELVQQLLAFSRQQLTKRKRLDLNAVIGDSVRMIERLIGEDIALETRLQPALAPVRADASQINQILMNLAVNAKDAMPSGGRLTIETADVAVDAESAARPGLNPGPYVLLSVADTGSGIDAGTLPHLFEPFFTTKGPGKGVGLGLSTVYGIVKQNRGWIGVQSEPGGGATFQIYWPKDDSEPVPEPAQEAPRPFGIFPGIETVLLVEDQEQVRSIVRDMLAECGYRVLTCSDGAAALSLAGTQPGPIELLLTDVVMPGMSGPQLAERLKVSYPAMKVLYMSGYSGDAIARRGILAPDVAYLPKPFTAADLSEKIRAVLGAGPADSSDPPQ